MRDALSSSLKVGLLAALFVACRDIPLDAFRLDLQEPVVFMRASALVLVVYAGLGLAFSVLALLLLGLIGRPLRRLLGAAPDAASRAALVIVALLVLWSRGAEAATAAETWYAIAAVALLIELGRRAGLLDLSGPLPSWLPLVLGLLAADALAFGVQRLVVERASGGPAMAVVMQLGGLLVALAVGAAVWGVGRRLSGLLTARVAERTVGLAVGAVLIVMVGLPAAWQLVLGASELGPELARVAGGLPGGSSPERPNVILISVDALRADYPGYAGGPAKTPVMDGLASRSFVFERAWSVSPWTRPSFAAFFSGVYPSEMGVGRVPGQSQGDPSFYPVAWDAERTLLAEALREAGYATLAVATNGNLTREARADQGYRLFYHCSLHPGVGLLRVATRPLGLSPYSWENLERAPVVTEHAVRVARAVGSRPVLLWVHYMDPHQPYDPPTIPPEARVESTSLAMAGADASGAPERERFIDAYTAEIEYCDESLGRLVRTLEAQGLWDSSVVVFWSDHGEEFWEHGGVDHGQSLFDELLRVPLMIHVPGQTEGESVDAPVSLLDVMPTVLELCGLDAPEGCRGRSLAPVLEGEPGEPPPLRVFLEGCRRGGIRKGWLDGRHKLIYHVYHDRFSLYDLEQDPAEQHDIYGAPGAPDTARWERELLAWTEMTTGLMARRTGAGAEEVSDELRQQLRDMGYVQ